MPIPQAVAGAARNAALGSLGEVVRSPLARAMVRYWWVGVPLAYIGWHGWQQRKAKGLKPHAIDVVNDVAPALTVVIGLVMLNQALAASEAPPAKIAQPLATKDADFTMRTPSAVTATPSET